MHVQFVFGTCFKTLTEREKKWDYCVVEKLFHVWGCDQLCRKNPTFLSSFTSASGRYGFVVVVVVAVVLFLI